jgi:hypothetical protein
MRVPPEKLAGKLYLCWRKVVNQALRRKGSNPEHFPKGNIQFQRGKRAHPGYVMEEIIVNLHMHTHYSDGSGNHQTIARAAIRCGLDAVIVTDHNVLVRGIENYFKDGRKKVLVLVGEEVHDQLRDPQKNHLLVFGADKEMATFAENPQTLIKTAGDSGGLTFIAHPFDPAAQAFNEPDISWEDWSVHNFTGVELWNGLSELKTLIPTKLHGVFYSLFPSLIAHRPQLKTIQKWDELLKNRHVVAIGGSDAHALFMQFGPLTRIIYPYEFHFSAINTHLMIRDALIGDVISDKKLIYDALAAGHCFVGYDLGSPTRGFRFIAHGNEVNGIMGDEVSVKGGVTLEAYIPDIADIRLLRNGKVISSRKRTRALTFVTQEPGTYRIEAYRKFLGIKRGWIFSNPIYIR